MIYYAHKKDDGTYQTVCEHCEQTADLASSFSVPELKEICYLIGLFHDAGKYQQSFQKRINGNFSVHVDHSTCGAKLISEIFGNSPSVLALLAELCIAGHHSGIPNCGTKLSNSTDGSTLYSRLKKNSFDDYSQFTKDIRSYLLPDEKRFAEFLVSGCDNKTENLIEKFAFIVRYCFSCLTDADSLDTAEFCVGETNRSVTADFNECLAIINRKLNSFIPKTELQKARALLQNKVFTKSDNGFNFHLLNMPTGSGKTLCSMKFALERAIKAEKKRIIYVIPYNSIIDQTASEFENLFGAEHILRHQSTFNYEDMADIDEDYRNAAILSCENWDAQIIITTTVQFMESIYANKRGKLRKMHNMANSIILFDEAHLMPVDYFEACLKGIYYVSELLGSEIVFLTATMPDYQSLLKKFASTQIRIQNLITDTSDFKYFKKCRYTNIGKQSDEAIVMKAAEMPSSLIVVNSRRHARNLYELCSGVKFHLSTWMTVADREKTISAIKAELKKLEADYPDIESVPQCRRITVVSTSLIEAGVDLDFHSVFRELTGLDSVLQSGGRCNREGKRASADVYIFNSENAREDVKTNITKNIFDEFDDVSSTQAVTEYYKRVYAFLDERLSQKSISHSCKDIWSIPFSDYSVKIIDDNASYSIAVPIDKTSRELIDLLKYRKIVKSRQLQRYCVSVGKNDFRALYDMHMIDDYGTGVYCLKNADNYSSEIGIKFESADFII